MARALMSANYLSPLRIPVSAESLANLHQTINSDSNMILESG